MVSLVNAGIFCHKTLLGCAVAFGVVDVLMVFLCVKTRTQPHKARNRVFHMWSLRVPLLR